MRVLKNHIRRDHIYVSLKYNRVGKVDNKDIKHVDVVNI